MMEKLEVFPFLSQDKNIADIQLALYSNWANDGLLFFTLGDAVRSGRIHHLTIHGYNADRETSYTSYFDFVRTPDGHLDSCRPLPFSVRSSMISPVKSALSRNAISRARS